MRVSSFLLIIYSVCIVWPVSVEAETLALSGNWEYQDSDSATDQFSQRYGIDFNKRVDVTELMRLDAGMRYNRNRQPGNTREDLNPSLSYDISNEIFNLDLSGNVNQQRNSSTTGTSNRTWSANLNSSWLASGIRPVISANFNQMWQNDDLDPHLSESDDSNSGVSLSWGGSEDPVHVFYSYNRQEGNNHVADSRSQSDNHFAKVEGEGSFWGNKGHLALSQQYAYTKNKSFSRVDAASGTAQVIVSVTAYSAILDPAANASLTLNSALTNNNKTDVALTVNDPADPNRLAVGIKSNGQVVKSLYLYTDTTLPSATSSQFGWDLYFSNDNTNWTLAKTNITASYDSGNNRFVIDISGYQKNFLRVVAVNDPVAASVNFSEIEVYQEVSSSATTALVASDNTNWTTDANLSMQLRPNLTLTSNFSYTKDEYSAGSGQQTTKLSGGLGWDADYYLNVQLNGSLNSTSSESAATYQTRTYGLTLTSPVLPTLDTAFGTTISQYLEGGAVLSTSYNYNLQMNAAIYHDLDARLNASYAKTDNEGDQSSLDTKSTGLVLTARLIPGLTADFSGTYTKSSGQSGSIATVLTANWRMSEELSLNSSYRQTWASQNSNSIYLALAWAMTRNMQVSISHNYVISPEHSHVTALDWRWTINRHISLLTSGSLLSAPSSWAFNSRLNSRFTML